MNAKNSERNDSEHPLGILDEVLDEWLEAEISEGFDVTAQAKAYRERMEAALERYRKTQ